MTPPPQADAASSDVFDPQTRSAVMRRVKGRDTSPELKVRRLLWSLGARYRLHRKELAGCPDIVLAGPKLAVFVHGCFWHGHHCRRGERTPKQNRAYWETKIGRNRARDTVNQDRLVAAGWTPVVLWECELKDTDGLRRRLQQLLLDPLRAPPPPAP